MDDHNDTGTALVSELEDDIDVMVLKLEHNHILSGKEEGKDIFGTINKITKAPED